MFAVIKTGGKQYRVQEGDVLEVEKLQKKEGQKVVFKEVLLIGDEDNVLLGTPLVEKAQVRAEVVENFKDEKVVIFKKKRRKQYRRTGGHRQELTRVKIEQIIAEAKTAPKESKVKEEKKEKAPTKPIVKKEADKKGVKEEKLEKEGKKETMKTEAKKEAQAPKKSKASMTIEKKQKVTKKAPSSKKVTRTKEK